MIDDKCIYVYAGWKPYEDKLIGTLHVSNVKGRETFSFEYDEAWLAEDNTFLDPDLSFYRGRQYLADDKMIFGVFADSCPDRWGRLLMNRREVIRAKNAGEKPKKLLESDYLLGVYDEARMGGLRFKTDKEGEFLSADKSYATPPWTSLRTLESASIAFENDESGLQEKWLKQLLAPGSSLGGARPKATVMDNKGELWIAKFPSKHDEWNTGAWEMVTHDLAVLCGLNAPEARLETFSKQGSTFLTKRFDRKGKERIHFSSAMSMLGKNDGADSTDGSSYLEIASFIKSNGARPKKDLQELWKRIVFSMAVSNTDDHFRNHGFLLTDDGWVLSPLYDVNPDIYGDTLSLNVNDRDAHISFDLAVDASKYYDVPKKEAVDYVNMTKEIVQGKWRDLAKQYGISHGAILQMEPAFDMGYK